MATCKKCGSQRAMKNGIVANKQRYQCKECGCNFREGDERTNERVAAKKALCIFLYAMAKGSYRMLGRILGADHTLVYHWIRAYSESLPEPTVWEKSKKWSLMKCGIKAIDRSTGNTVAWVLGGRDTATFRRLYDKVKHLKDCAFYTDHWAAFAHVLPPERHIIWKAHTACIERENSNTRHYLGRFTRRTKVVSRLELMVELTLRIWCAVTTTSPPFLSCFGYKAKQQVTPPVVSE